MSGTTCVLAFMNASNHAVGGQALQRECAAEWARRCVYSPLAIDVPCQREQENVSTSSQV